MIFFGRRVAPLMQICGPRESWMKWNRHVADILTYRDIFTVPLYFE